jgi:exosortase/archaeosortase family protein
MRLSRAEFFASLFILGCANGVAGKIIASVNLRGWANAAFGTFDISAIVVVSCIASIWLMLRSTVDEVRSADIAVGTAVSLLIILPIAAMAWFALTVLSLYILVFTKVDDSARRSAIILLATSVPMLWSRMLFDFFAKSILEADASLVAWVLGTHRTGIMVEFTDHSGTLVILPPCSSLANVSLALLCWVTVSQFLRHKWRPQDFFWCLLACASVVAVNVVRISLMGLDVSHYDAIHGTLGDVIANTAILGLTVTISLWGVRGEAFSRV